MKGQSLIEVLVALAVSVAIIAGITVSVLSALKNVQFSKNQNLATSYATQGMEIVRKIRDFNSSLSAFDSIYYCLAKNTTELILRGVNGCGQNVDIFLREVDLERNTLSCPNATRSTVIVSWSDSACTSTSNLFCHQVKLTSCLADLNKIAIP